MASKFLLPLLLALAALPVQAKMYKWVDAQGNVHYTDTLPPNAAAQGNAEMSKTGNIINKTESAEEKRKRLAEEAAAAERRKVADEQARKDRALLATYTSEQEIDLARDRALDQRRLVINSAEARLKQLGPSVDDLEKKVDAASKGGRRPPDYLVKQYDAKRLEVEETKDIVKTNQDAMVDVRNRYEADKLRFRELTAKP